MEAAGAELVHFVEHHHHVARAGLFQALDDVARQRADVGAAVSAYLRLVVHAAQTHAHELAPGGARDALAERGLAHAGRAGETEDGRLALRVELAHGEVFEDAILDLLQAVVVLVENPARLIDVDRRCAGRLPWQFGEPVEIGAHHRVFAGRFGHALQALEFLQRLFLDFFGHAGIGDGFGDFLQLGCAFISFAKLLLDGAKLFAQQVLAALLADRLLGALIDLLRDAQHLGTARQDFEQAVEPGAQIEGFQQRLLLFDGGVHQHGNDIRQLRRCFNRPQAVDHFLRYFLRQHLEDFDGALLQGQRPRFDLLVILRGLGDALHARDEEVVAIEELQHAKTLLALADDMVCAVGSSNITQHVGGGADPMQVVGTRLFDLALALQQHTDRALGAGRELGGGERAGAADGDRNQGAGEQHHVAHRQYDQRIFGQRLRGTRCCLGRRTGRRFTLRSECGCIALCLRGVAGILVFGHRVHLIFLMVSTRQPSLHCCESSSSRICGSTRRRSK